jgi:hypothetical protein
MGSEVSGMGLKASGASLHVMIANFDVQQCTYLKWPSARINMKSQMISYTEALIHHPSFFHLLISSASLSFLRARSKKDLFARSSENAAMLLRTL